MADQSTGIYGHWGQYASAAQLPNVASATLQTAILKIGDLAVAEEVVYQCTTALLGGAVWAALAGGGGGGSSPVLWKWNETDTSQFTPASAAISGATPTSIQMSVVPAGEQNLQQLRVEADYTGDTVNGAYMVPINDLPVLPRRFIIRYEAVVPLRTNFERTYSLVGPWTDQSSTPQGILVGVSDDNDGTPKVTAYIVMGPSYAIQQEVWTGMGGKDDVMMLQHVVNSHVHIGDGNGGSKLVGMSYLTEVDERGSKAGAGFLNVSPITAGAATQLNQVGIGAWVNEQGEAAAGMAGIGLSSFEILKHPMDL